MEIATAFPGLFNYEAILNLDVRDFACWERKARVANLRKRIIDLNTARLAMHGDEQFVRQVQDLIDQIELIEQPVLSGDEQLAKWEETVGGLKSFLDEVKKRSRR